MSQEELSSRKDKKAQRDADRRKSGKKRKRDDVKAEKPKDAPGNELQQDFIPLDVGDEGVSESRVKSKPSSKKRKAEALERDSVDDGQNTANTTSSKPKKRKKAKKAEAENGETAPGDTTAPLNKTSHRFVCFIGNLPYTTTDASLHAHFKKLAPFTLRHRTDPATGKSKGFAFLEFENYDRMKTCLKLYHHTMFDPDNATGEVEVAEDGEAAVKENKKGQGKSKGARRINVELTAGGGGKNAGRKEKIKVKNQRLTEQRARRIEAEKAERAKEAMESGEVGKAGNKKGKKPQQSKAGVSAERPDEDQTAGMHPSRLARMKA